MNRRAVVAMAATASGGVALLAIAWVAARRLTPIELGFFFSFLSFGALVQLGDFGLSYATLQAAAHLTGTSRRHELPALSRRMGKWNLLATCAMAVVVAILGFATFSSEQGTGVPWLRPWIGYLVGVVANQLTVPRLSLREGGGKISQMWAVRLVQEWVAGGCCLVALIAGAGLWSLAAFAASRAIVAAVWLAFGDPLPVSSNAPSYTLQRWMTEVWPFQWRIGLSGVSGFLIFRAFAPIVLLEKGAVAAGQFGLAISFMNLLIAVTTAWPLSHAARYAALNASGGFDELRREFPPMLWASTALAITATVVSAVALYQARIFEISVALRLPDPVTTSVILATAVIHHFVSCFAVFLRAEGREPLLLPSILGGIFTVLVVWITAYFGDLRDIAVANLACASIGIPIVAILFRARTRSAVRAAGLREERPA